jgi:hypothetical protein
MIATVVLTGGPGAGKSSLLNQLPAVVAGGPWSLLRVPGASTILFSAGVTLSREQPNLLQAEQESFQRATLALQITLRVQAHALAEAAARPTLLVFDRGEMDGRPYLPADTFRLLLGKFGLDPDTICGFYDLVLHLRTPAADTYTTNEVRSESHEVAAGLDRETALAWRHHPNRVTVGAYASFDQKVGAALAAIRDLLASHCERTGPAS